MTEFKTDFDGTEEIIPMPQKTKDRMFIYFLLDGRGKVVYVGQSAFPQSRVWQHRRSKQFTSYKFFECDPKLADNIELTLYSKHSPKYNLVPPVDQAYSSLDAYKKKNKAIRGKIRRVRKFLAENPVDTLAGLYPVSYLDQLKMEVAK